MRVLDPHKRDGQRIGIGRRVVGRGGEWVELGERRLSPPVRMDEVGDWLANRLPDSHHGVPSSGSLGEKRGRVEGWQEGRRLALCEAKKGLLHPNGIRERMVHSQDDARVGSWDHPRPPALHSR